MGGGVAMRVREHQLERARPPVPVRVDELAWLRKRRPLVWSPPPRIRQICAAPTFQAVGTAGQGVGDVVALWPAHLADDVGLLFVETDGAEAVAAPAGWTAVTNTPVINGTATRLSVFWRRATSGAETDPTVVDPGNHCYARIATFRGCITTGDPWDVVGVGGTSGGTTTNVTFPGVTTTVADTLVVAVMSWASDSAGPLLTTFANANLTGLAEQGDEGTTQGSGGGIAFATGTKAAAGATGDTTGTASLALNYACIHIALRPPIAGNSGSLSTSIGTIGIAATGALRIAGALSTSIGSIALSAAGAAVLSTPPELYDPIGGNIGLR
jgi:hypothetical protein